MTTQAALAKNSADDVVGRLRTVAHELLDIQLADLKRIAEIGMEIIEGLGRMAHEAEAGPDVPGRNAAPPRAETVVLAFARASRAVRLTFALQTDLVEKLRRAEAAGSLSAYVAEAFAPTTRHTAPSPAAEPTPERARKDAIAGVLTDVVHDAAGDDRERLERLIHEAGERLNETDRFADILARPMSEVIAHVCAELGLDPDWTRLSRQAWAVGEVKSGAVGEVLKPPSPWMGDCEAEARSSQRSGMGVAPYPASPEAVEPPPPPIPALSPIQGERSPSL